MNSIPMEIIQEQRRMIIQQIEEETQAHIKKISELTRQLTVLSDEIVERMFQVAEMFSEVVE